MKEYFGGDEKALYEYCRADAEMSSSLLAKLNNKPTLWERILAYFGAGIDRPCKYLRK